MDVSRHRPHAFTRLSAQVLIVLPLLWQTTWAAPPAVPNETAKAEPQDAVSVPDPLDGEHVAIIRNVEEFPIDLATALQLAGVQNPDLLLGEQRVTEAVGMRQLAAAQCLPTLNGGTNFDSHTGALQQSNGNILSVNRNSLYVGAGARAIAAGTVGIPGVTWNFNVSNTIYNYLINKQLAEQSHLDSVAVRNETMLKVVVAYLDLLEAEGVRAVRYRLRNDSAEVARLTAAYSKTGQGRKADADRAATDLRDRTAVLIELEGRVMQRSAKLAQILNLDPSIRLHPTDNYVVPHQIVPVEITLPELVATAMLQRPELLSSQVAIRQAFLNLEGAHKLPFSPTVLINFSSGLFGGGSNLVSQPVGSGQFARGTPYFGDFAGRYDLEGVAYWSLQNFGVGNKALIDAARSRLRSADFERLIVLDQVRAEVARAFVRMHARFGQIRTAEEAVSAASKSWEEDLNRIKAGEGLPIEVLDSLHLLTRAEIEYLKAIVGYNRAQFELYIALGNPPANMLVRTFDEQFQLVPTPADGAIIPPLPK